MLSKNHTLKALSLIILLFTLPQTVLAKSVYVITDTDGPEVAAYKIQGTSLAYQTNYVCEPDWGAVGLAVDAASGVLFVTFELENVIELVNSKAMQYIDTVTAIGADDLAGIVVDHARSKVYIIDRETNHLYVYSWHRATRQLTPDLPKPYYVELEDCYQGYGLALDEQTDRLYVADNSTTVKYL